VPRRARRLPRRGLPHRILLIAALGIAVGLVVGAVIPFAAGSLLASVVPVSIGGIYPVELALAAVYGFLTALAFALYPLGRARMVSATALFRAEVAPVRQRPPLAYLAAVALALAALAGLAIVLAYDPRIAAVFVAATAGAFLLLRVVAMGVMALARHAPRSRSTMVRLAVGSIHRPGALTPAVVLSLGLGLTLLVALVLIDGNFRRELFGTIPATAPSFFILDIPGDEAAGLAAFVAANAPGATLEMQPMLRGRITRSTACRPKAEVDADARWVLRGDRGITYSATPPAENPITAGAGGRPTTMARRWSPSATRSPPGCGSESATRSRSTCSGSRSRRRSRASARSTGSRCRSTR
jgi:putative ABC transport system permease protein